MEAKDIVLQNKGFFQLIKSYSYALKIRKYETELLRALKGRNIFPGQGKNIYPVLEVT
jgi:hypothetical protein